MDTPITSSTVPPPPPPLSQQHQQVYQQQHQQQQQQQVVAQQGVDEFLLNDSVLQQRMHKFLDQSGVRKFQAGILRVLDYAVQARLRGVLEALVRARQLRSRRLAARGADGSFTSLPLRVTSDPGAALRYAERLMRSAEMLRAAADRRALRDQKRNKRNAENAATGDGGGGDDDESEEEESDIDEESDESDVVISNEDDDEDDDDDDDDDDPDADVDDKTKKRKRGAAAVKRGPGRKGKRSKVVTNDGAAGPSDEMTQAEAARQARLDRLKALEEQQRERASMDSAASVALNNVGVAKDKDELARKLKEREVTRDTLKKRLGELNFKESERALLLKLRGQKAGQMEKSEVAQLRLIEVRWEAFKKLSEMLSVFAKEIENLNQQLNADPEAERQRLLESEAEHLASRVAEQAAMVGGVPPPVPIVSTAAATTATEPAPSKRRRKASKNDDDDDDDDDYDARGGDNNGGGGGGGAGSDLKIEPTTARTAAKAGLAFYNVEPEVELPLVERLATPAYTTPLVTLDDCQMLRNTEIPSHVFDRFEIAQLKQRMAAHEASLK
jgi:hypothetical protein